MARHRQGQHHPQGRDGAEESRSGLRRSLPSSRSLCRWPVGFSPLPDWGLRRAPTAARRLRNDKMEVHVPLRVVAGCVPDRFSMMSLQRLDSRAAIRWDAAEAGEVAERRHGRIALVEPLHRYRSRWPGHEARCGNRQIFLKSLSRTRARLSPVPRRASTRPCRLHNSRAQEKNPERHTNPSNGHAH